MLRKAAYRLLTRAAHNRSLVFRATSGAVTVRERAHQGLFQHPAKRNTYG